MSIFATIKRHLLGERPDPFVLDAVTVKALEGITDWRDEKVKQAAERFGKPFKCAADGVPRERLRHDTREIEIVRPKATVTDITKGRKR